MTATRWTPIYLTLGHADGRDPGAAALGRPGREMACATGPGQLIPGFWMAWTFPVALFFWIIASLLIIMTLLAIRFPETPRVGILRIETTRGDRLFISLLGLGLHPSWLALLCGPRPLWGALDPLPRLCRSAVFRWV